MNVTQKKSSNDDSLYVLIFLFHFFPLSLFRLNLGVHVVDLKAWSNYALRALVIVLRGKLLLNFYSAKEGSW